MNRIDIIEEQKIIGVTPDGIWGIKSQAAAQAYLRDLMPSPSPWPKRNAAAAFYGAPGDARKHTQIDVTGLGVKYDNAEVTKITCNKKIAASLLRIIKRLATFPEGKQALARYAGVYSNRSIRGGTATSIHAFAAAIDLDAENNGNFTHWPTNSTMSLKVAAEFAKEGFLSAGPFWNRDAMHHEAINHF